MRATWILVAALAAGLVVPAARAHELWFNPSPGGDPAPVRLYFGDAPRPGAAERVAEVAHTKVWADGRPLDVKRLADGLEVRLPARDPAILSAFADRGVVTYLGDSFIISLAAYYQSRPIEPGEAVKLGVDDDQLRLLLFSREGREPVVRAVWRGKPVAGAVVKVFHGPGEPTESRTDHRGEMPCPDRHGGLVSLLAQVVDKSPGRRDGKDYSEIRYKATLAIAPEAGRGPAGTPTSERLGRVKEVHGVAGPWAVAGYRIGERALKELGLPRHSLALEVIHRCPAHVQYSCIADGVQAATGASPGKRNLRIEETTRDGLKTVIRDTRSGRTLIFTLKPEFARSITDLPEDRLEAEGRRVAALPDEVIFSFGTSK